MKVHLKQIPTQGLHLEGEEECPIQELESEGIRCAGRLHYDIDLGVAGRRIVGKRLAVTASRTALRVVSRKISARSPSACICCAHGAPRAGDCRSYAIYARGYFAKPPGASALRQGRRSGLQGETGQNCGAGYKAQLGLECVGQTEV